MAAEDHRGLGAQPEWGVRALRALLVLRFAVLGGLFVVYLGRQLWPTFYVWLHSHVLGVVVAWLLLSLAFWILRAWLRRQRRTLQRPAASAPWQCAVCDQVNPPGQEKCLTCTVPRPA